MAKISVTVTGLDRILAGLEGAQARVDRDAPDIVQRAGTRYQSWAKFFAPVDTTRLRGDIRIAPGGVLDVTVTSHAPYSGFQEFGTSRMSPQPYMGPSERSVSPEVADEFGDLGRNLF